MKKIILLSILFLLVVAFSAFAQWDDCPYGETYCEGQCGRFVDTDDDGYCDHSEPAPEDRTIEDPAESDEAGEAILDEHEIITGQELKTKTVSEVAVLYEIDIDTFTGAISDYLETDVSPEDNFQYLVDSYGAAPSIVKDIAYSIKTGTYLAEEKEQEQTSVPQKEDPPYVFWPVVIVGVSIYAVSYFLAKKKIFSMMKHKKIWNMFLLASFFGTAITGFFMVLRINYGIRVNFPFNLWFWHVEAGLVMLLIATFHILWHMSYFKTYLKAK